MEKTNKRNTTKKAAPKSAAKKNTTTKKSAPKKEVKQSHPLLSSDVVLALKYFGEYPTQLADDLDELKNNAFLYDQMAGLKVYDSNNKYVVGGTTWTVHGKEMVLKLVECIEQTIDYAKGIKWQGVNEYGSPVAVSLPKNENVFLWYWQELMSQCSDLEGLIKAFFCCSIVWKPLHEKGKFCPYTTHAFSEMWYSVSALLQNIEDAQWQVDKVKRDVAYNALVAYNIPGATLTAPNHDHEAKQIVTQKDGKVWDVIVDYAASTNSYIYCREYDKDGKCTTKGKIDFDTIESIQAVPVNE